TMYEWMESWIAKSPGCYRVVRSYYSTLEHLKTFNPALEWDDLDLNFYDDFVSYLQDQNYAKNTIGDRIKNLKAMCNAAYHRNIHKNTAYENFKKTTEESYNVYLNEEELNIISALDL